MSVRENSPRRSGMLGVHLLTSTATASLLSMGMSVGSYAGPLPESFADLAQKVSPAVVNISSTHAIEGGGGDSMLPPFKFPEGSPFDEFFKQFQGQGDGQHQSHPRKVMSLGSGFIIDPSGFVVTNNHVIDGAKDIEVTLNDGKELKARLIGTDPKTDLALLKVDAGHPLPAVPFGDSDRARIGDWVLAVGNPFGLGGTVTAGIISARGRDIDSGPYDDYLQLDAAINQGNSGGPTFDADGRVVGVNTAIASPNGGSVGIGFAIPSNLAQPIIAELKTQGHVERGWLGVAIQEVTPDLAEGLGLTHPEGALIATVEPGSPAASAGLVAGDVVRKFGDTVISGPKDLSRAVAATPEGSVVPVRIWRGTDESVVNVKVAAMQESEAAAAPEAPADAALTPGESVVLGATLAPLDENDRHRLGLKEGTEGAILVSLGENSPLAEAGLQPGDVILRINDRAVTSPADVGQAVSAMEGTQKTLALLIRRGGDDRFVAVHAG